MENPAAKEPVPAVAPEAHAAGEAEAVPPVQDPRALLLRIASAVEREALESLLQSFDGARIQGDRLILEPGPASDFVRRRIKDNLSIITQAAAKIIGSKVTVVLEESESRQEENPQSKSDSAPESDILEKAKREPVIKSFLDTFPGPVKAEKIDS